MDMREAEIRSRIIKAMAHPARLLMIEQLKTKPRSFAAIHERFKLDKSTVSKHLLVLKQAGIVSSCRSGSDMIYRLDCHCVLEFLGCITEVIQTNVKKQQQCLCHRQKGKS